MQRGTNFWLSCQFELPVDEERLYSVKWYKNNEEFYRLILADAPISGSDSSNSQQQQQQQQQYFAQAGVNVMVSVEI